MAAHGTRGAAPQTVLAAARTRVGRAGPVSPATALGCVAIIGVILWSAFRSGGYFPATFTAIGAVLFLALAGQIALARAVPRLPPVAWTALGALVALALWTGLSSSWSTMPDLAVLDFERTAGYVAAFAIGLLVSAAPHQSRWLVGSVMLALAVVVAAAATSRLLPGVIEGNADTDAIGMYRLGYPLSYWNAVGAVSAMCAVLAVGHAASRRSTGVVRAGSAALAVLAVVTLALTLSRASWIAFAAGVAVLLLVSVQRARLVATLLVAGVAAGPVVAVVLSTDALVVDPSAGAGQREAGTATALLLLAAMAGAALGTTVIQAVSRTLVHIPQRTLSRAGLVLAGLVIVVAALGYGAAGNRVEGETASGIDRVERFFERQWDEFNTAASVPTTGPERLTSAGGTRSRVFSEALDGWRAAPMVGEGAGSFSVRWAREREVGEDLRDAHSLPLETLSELGLIGFGFLLLFAGSVAVGVVQRRRSRGRTLPRAVNAAVAGTLAVWAVHASVDWDWEMPGVTLPALFLAGAVFPAVRRARTDGASTQAPQPRGRGEAGPVRPAPGA